MSCAVVHSCLGRHFPVSGLIASLAYEVVERRPGIGCVEGPGWSGPFRSVGGEGREKLRTFVEGALATALEGSVCESRYDSEFSWVCRVWPLGPLWLVCRTGTLGVTAEW